MINFQIPASNIVKLIIYDATGREVVTLVNETLAAGSYEVEFNAGYLSSGIYFYRLESVNYTKTKKMTLIK